MQKLTRIKAGLFHFCLSLTLFSVIFFVLLSLWYPEPYFSAAGGWQGLKIVAGIDVVLGPLLTLVIFNPTKSTRELRMDLTLIACFQTVALIWGIFTVYQQRPVAVVFWDDSFLTVTAADLKRVNYPLEQLQQFSPLNPPLIYAEKPTSTEGLKQLLANMRDTEIAPHHQTDLYRPLNEHFAAIASQQLPMDDILKNNPAMRSQRDKLLNNSKRSPHELQYFSLKAKYHDSILVFTAQGEFVGYLTV
jgi:hypothetical protein